MDIEAILAVLIPIILECLEDRTEEEVAASLVDPTFTQKIGFLIRVRRKDRTALRAAMNDPEGGCDEELAAELIAKAREAA